MQRRLAQQREIVDRIDSKAAILIGFLAVFLVGITTIPSTANAIPYSRLAVVILLGAAIVFGLIALWPRAWHTPPNPEEYVRYESWTIEQAQAEEADGAYASVVVNDDSLNLKLWWFNACLVLVAITVAAFVVSTGWQSIRNP